MHTLPEDQAELARVARRMGYHPPEHPDPAATLLADFTAHTTAVRQLYDFKHGARAGSGSVLMKPTVEHLSLDDMIALAAYLASLPP